MTQKKEHKHRVEITNRKARFNYILLDFFTAGIALTGTEIKSVREGKASLVDSFCYIDHNGEVWLKNSYVAKYDHGTYLNHEERRLRKLLLTKKEIKQIKKAVEQPFTTCVPLKMFINNRGLCKVEIAIGRGKKLYDKRQTIKEREAKIEMSRIRKR